MGELLSPSTVSYCTLNFPNFGVKYPQYKRPIIQQKTWLSVIPSYQMILHKQHEHTFKWTVWVGHELDHNTVRKWGHLEWVDNIRNQWVWAKSVEWRSFTRFELSWLSVREFVMMMTTNRAVMRGFNVPRYAELPILLAPSLRSLWLPMLRHLLKYLPLRAGYERYWQINTNHEKWRPEMVEMTQTSQTCKGRTCENALGGAQHHPSSFTPSSATWHGLGMSQAVQAVQAFARKSGVQPWMGCGRNAGCDPSAEPSGLLSFSILQLSSAHRYAASWHQPWKEFRNKDVRKGGQSSVHIS